MLQEMKEYEAPHEVIVDLDQHNPPAAYSAILMRTCPVTLWAAAPARPGTGPEDVQMECGLRIGRLSRGRLCCEESEGCPGAG